MIAMPSDLTYGRKAGLILLANPAGMGRAARFAFYLLQEYHKFGDLNGLILLADDGQGVGQCNRTMHKHSLRELR